MITKPTVFILGAGASQPYGFPLGSGLTNMIRAMEQLPDKLRDYLVYVGYTEDAARAKWEDFYNAFCDSDHDSLDAFIHDRKEFDHIGKAAMAFRLLELENPNKFKERGHTTWYKELFRCLEPEGETSGILDYSHNKVSFVTFNYDRSLEAYLTKTLTARNGSGNRYDVEAVLANMPVIHVYGSLGNLRGLGDDAQPYANGQSPQAIKRAVESIHLATGPRDTTPELTQAHNKFKEAERIFILGFGFNAQNVERLQLDRFANCKITATDRGLGPNTMNKMREMLPKIEFLTGDCLALVSNPNIGITSEVPSQWPMPKAAPIISAPAKSPFDV
jgi:hypothetical protein